MAFHREMDVTLPVRRETPRLALRATACALLVLMALAPLGVPRLSAGRGVVVVLSPGNYPPAQLDFFTVVLGRLAMQIPLGDLPMRLAILSAVLSAVALGLWVRAGLEVACLLRAPMRARSTAGAVAHEPVAVLGAACVVAISPPFFICAVDAGLGGTALVLVAAWTWATTLLIRDGSDTRAALGASFIGGVAVASFPLLGPLLIPCGLALWIWGLTRRARWSLLAPVLFLMGTVFLFLAGIFNAEQASSWGLWWDVCSLGGLRRALGSVTGPQWLSAGLLLGESLGVVAGLLGMIGCGVLAWRAPAVAAVVGFTLWASVLMAAASPRPEAALSLWLGIAVIPLSTGTLWFAAKLGRARIPAAWALVVMSAVAPALAGGPMRWLPDGRLPLRLLLRAHAKLAPTSLVEPGSQEMHVMLQYGRVLGLRPDLVVNPEIGMHPSASPTGH